MKARVIEYLIMVGIIAICAGCKVDQAEQEIKKQRMQTRYQARLEVAQASCEKSNGKLMYKIGFGFGESEPNYYNFQCIPDGVIIRIEK